MDTMPKIDLDRADITDEERKLAEILPKCLTGLAACGKIRASRKGSGPKGESAR